MYVPIIRLRKKDNFNKVDVFRFRSKHLYRYMKYYLWSSSISRGEEEWFCNILVEYTVHVYSLIQDFAPSILSVIN